MLYFFFNDTATTEIYTLSLHDALPIWREGEAERGLESTAAADEDDRYPQREHGACGDDDRFLDGDRKSTRLNSSHSQISYAVFCLKKNLQDRVDPQVLALQ